MKMAEIDLSASKGEITVDGKVVLKSRPLMNADGTESEEYSGVDIRIGKAAVEPVWFLPGVAERFGMYVEPFSCASHFNADCFLCLRSSESLLRRALFEDTGGMYPELITR